VYRIVFDQRPGNGGPARYIASILRELVQPEWHVSFVDTKQHASDKISATSQLSPPTIVQVGVKKRIVNCMPKHARALLGFCREARRMAAMMQDTKIDIFHAQNTGCEEIPVAARKARVPRVLGTFHVDSTYDLDRSRSGFSYRSLEWYSNRCLHKAIAVSEATKRDWMRRTGIPDHRVVTIHNGIDPDHFRRTKSKEAARASLGLPQDALVIGGLGRLDAAKGFAYLIEAMALLRPNFPHAHVAIAGTGPLQQQLEAQAIALGIADRVTFLGFRSDVNEVLDACDVFVLSSLCEALPFALLEAMAHELPVVGTTVGGVPEVIVPSETGLLVSPRDPVALAEALKALLESAELREHLGRAGRARVVRDFHEADMVRKTIQVYRDMLAPPRGSKR
jgi:glycosyltransferase involved in cell wall biosynthesis